MTEPRPNDRQSYSPDEIAERHGCHRATIWRAMKAGKLGYRRPFGGSQRRITLEDEQRWQEGVPPWNEGKIRPHIPGDGFIYFIECGDFIKIGFTKSVPGRMRGLKNTIPHEIILLHSMRGTLAHEAQLLAQFAHLRHRGEWFRKATELLALIEQLKRRGSRP